MRMITEKPVCECDAGLGRLLVKSMREVMGRTQADALLERPEFHSLCNVVSGAGVPCEEIGALQASLEAEYGQRSGRGVALKIGRVAFKYCLREFGEELGVLERDFRLLPTRSRLRAGLNSLAALLERLAGGRTWVEETDREYRLNSQDCALCWGRAASAVAAESACSILVGFLGEFFSWASGGKHYQVVEAECCAAGATACRFIVNKQELD